jgi:hypothetical protein
VLPAIAREKQTFDVKRSPQAGARAGRHGSKVFGLSHVGTQGGSQLSCLQGINRRGAQQRLSFTYSAGVSRLPFGVAPDLAGRSQRIAADIEIPSQGAEGVIISQGSRYAGFAFYVKDGRLVYETDGFGPLQF